MTELKLCGAPYPPDADVLCTLGEGHGRVKPPGAVDWFDHMNARAGYWWNKPRTAREWAQLAVEPPGTGAYEPDVTEDEPTVADLAEISVTRGGVMWHTDALAGAESQAPGVRPTAEVDVETWYGVFNDPATLEPRFASGEIHENLRQPLLETPIFETRSLADALRHAQLTFEDRVRAQREQLAEVGRQLIHRMVVVDGKLERPDPGVPEPTPVVVRSQTVTRTKWADVDPATLRAAVGGVAAVREVSIYP